MTGTGGDGIQANIPGGISGLINFVMVTVWMTGGGVAQPASANSKVIIDSCLMARPAAS